MGDKYNFILQPGVQISLFGLGLGLVNSSGSLQFALSMSGNYNSPSVPDSNSNGHHRRQGQGSFLSRGLTRRELVTRHPMPMAMSVSGERRGRNGFLRSLLLRP